MFGCQYPPQVTSANLEASLDLQYQICSRFMRQTSGELLQREMDLIQKSQKFIEKIQDNLMNKDISTTQESFTLDSLNDQQDVFSQPSKSRLLLRKSHSNVTLRRSESGLSDALGEVRRKCSEKTAAVLSNLVNQAKRGRQKIMGFDRLEKELKRLQNKFMIKEEELFMLKKKLKNMEEKSHLAIQQISSLKSKLKQTKDHTFYDRICSSRLSDNAPISPHLSDNTPISPHQQNMRKYIQEKQLHMIQKQKDIKIMQNKLEQSFESPFGQKCDKCCQLMKKIKQSLMKYRNFLEQQSVMAQTMYQTYKKSFT